MEQDLFDGGRRQPRDAPALVAGGQVVTYGELDERVARQASALGPDRRLVLVTADNRVDSIVAYLAALRGRHPVLLAPRDDELARCAIEEAYRPDAVIEDGAITRLRARSIHRLHPDLALLLSTSGSTGGPKLVRLSRDNLRANAVAIAEYLRLTPDDRAITTLPLRYCYGLSVVNSHLQAGATVALTNRSVTDAGFWHEFRAVGATGFAGVPYTFDLLDRVGFAAMDLPTLRYVTQAGGAMAPATVERFAALGQAQGWELYVMYGQTEATARMAYLPPALARRHPRAVGIAIPGGELSIDQPDARGVGELVYRGPNVMLGYAETASDLARGRTVTALRTGDHARRNADGLIEIVGRASRFIKPFGVRVDLDDLERLLADHGMAAMCTGDDRVLTVAIEGGDPAAVRHLVGRQLRLPATRVRIVQLDELPRLANGKPDHAALRSGSVPEADIGSETTASSPVRAAFAATLGASPGDDDSFVDLGGDSLSYVELSVRLEELLGHLPPDWHLRPVRELTPPTGTARQRSPWARVEVTVVLRALAIVLIVGTHTRLWHLPGGAHALLAVAGYNFARFQLRAPSRLGSIARIAVPSMAWIAVVAAGSDAFSWANALLVNEFAGAPGDRWAYWFVEALVRIVVILAAVFSIPALRRIEGRWPFAMAGAALAVGLAIRFDLPFDLTTDHRLSRTHEVFWLFALGWAAARAPSRERRLLVTLVAAVAAFGFFGDLARELVVVAAVVLVVWVGAVTVPRVAVPFVARTASASLAIYLTHFQVHPPVTRALGPVAGTLVAVAVGIGVHALVSSRASVPTRRRRASASGAHHRPATAPCTCRGAAPPRPRHLRAATSSPPPLPAPHRPAPTEPSSAVR